VADEAVEVEGRGGAGVDLVVAHLGLRADGGGHLEGDAGGLLQRGALGRVEDDLELRLVVEGQHLDLDAPRSTSEIAPSNSGDAAEKHPAPAGPVDQRIHDAVVEAGEDQSSGAWSWSLSPEARPRVGRQGTGVSDPLHGAERGARPTA
jgi:hypothetical protein